MTEIAPDSIPRLPRGVKVRRDETRGGWVLLAPERAVKLDDIGAAIVCTLQGESPFLDALGNGRPHFCG